MLNKATIVTKQIKTQAINKANNQKDIQGTSKHNQPSYQNQQYTQSKIHRYITQNQTLTQTNTIKPLPNTKQ